MNVYVKWYGRVLEGELLDGEYLGMKQVAIPLDGHKPTALFSPGHAYNTQAEALAGHEEFSPAEARNKTFEVVMDPRPHPYANIPQHPFPQGPTIPVPCQKYIELELFKQKHWDQEHNHLQVEYLEEFYQLWRDYMAMVLPMKYPKQPTLAMKAMAMEAPLTDEEAMQPTKRIVTLTEEAYWPATELVSKYDTPSKLTKKQKQSTGVIEYTDATQLSIF